MIKVLRSLRFKEARFLGPCGLDRFTTLYPYNLKIVNKFLGTRNCEADERKRINE